MTAAVPQGAAPADRWKVDSPVKHLTGSAVVGLVVGFIAGVAISHAHDPAAHGLTLSLNGPESVVVVLADGLIVGPVVAAMFASARLMLAAAFAAVLGGPALAGLYALTLSGDAAGGPDRVIAWTLAVATVYTLAGAVTAGLGRRDILAAALALVLAMAAVAALELRGQDRWRTWDVAHHGVALVLPDLPGFEPTRMRFYSAGIHVEMTGGNGRILVDLLDGEASRVRVCPPSGACWDRGDRSMSDSVVTRRYGDRLIQINTDEARVEVPIDVPLRPVSAERLARLPVMPHEYAD